MSSLDGKVVLITGASLGLGKQSALELARHHPAQIWLSGRNMERLEDAAADIRRLVADCPPLYLLELDLASFCSIKAASRVFLAQCSRLDILMLNAGVMCLPPGNTENGYEMEFGVNHMGHALLTKLLLPVLLKEEVESPHVVVLSSSSHHDAPRGGIQWDSLKSPGNDLFILNRYGQSKLANVLFARELSRHFPQIRVAAVHPGIVRGTNLQASATGWPFIVRHALAFLRYFFTISLEQGVKNQVWAALADDYPNGEYFEPVGKPGNASPYARNLELAEALWAWTENELEAHAL
ncbi:short-chain dehydrogenase/reductase [Pyrenophora teres f. maculata]|nr:short-chain dehydrogenase/reductase [Pyrenophora teres f. maculata]